MDFAVRLSKDSITYDIVDSATRTEVFISGFTSHSHACKLCEIVNNIAEQGVDKEKLRQRMRDFALEDATRAIPCPPLQTTNGKE